MSETKLPTHIIIFDCDEYWLPLAATLTRTRADSIVEEIVASLVEEGRERWQKDFDDDPEGVRPFDADAVDEAARERVRIANWDLPFVGAEDPLDPHTLEMAIEYEEDHYDGEMFRP